MGLFREALQISLFMKGIIPRGAIAQRIENHEDILEVAEEWAEDTINRACNYAEEACKLIMYPAPSANLLKYQEPPTTRDSLLYAQMRTYPRDKIHTSSHSFSGKVTSSQPSVHRGGLPGRRRLPPPKPSIVPNVHPSLQYLAIIRMMENTKKAVPGMASSTGIPVPLPFTQPSQLQISSASYGGSQDCTRSSGKDSCPPYLSLNGREAESACALLGISSRRETWG